ncbi:PREDICTED: putative fatty acyl-CoA reductase CG5065, partial [Dinoponera quadriceps]|uniref:Fatty acyl-CoA reductase n=1 Tax=Dinoponera quadriceps TaxID=609295 RepID=A0A6P3XNU6_DINQU
MAHCGNSNVTIRQTPIQAFYAGQSIFITGGTGFLVKILIEKLLRSCPNVSKMCLMVCSKKNKSAATRLDEIFESPLFGRVKEEMPNFREKIVPVVGELYKVDLGFTKDDRDLLAHKVRNLIVKIQQKYFSYK